MAEHILFITGKLAEKSLHRVLESMQPTKFTYTVHQIGVSVAALITTEMIIRRLKETYGAKRIILPGRFRGDLKKINKHFNVEVERGPDELKDLPIYFDQTAKPTRLNKHNIKIFSEIVDAPNMKIEQICAQANVYKKNGADIIDIGCLPNTSFPHLSETIRELKTQGFVVSIDSMNSNELKLGSDAGADYVLSLNQQNLHLIDEIESIPIVIPSENDDLESLFSLIKELKANNRKFIADPILDPIHFGFTNSIVRYKQLRARFPDIEIMMGIGNLTELTHADTSGINALLVGIMSELDITYMLTTEVSEHCSKAVKEADTARRIMYAAKQFDIPPKGLSDELMSLHERKPYPYSEEEILENANNVKDPNYRVQTGKEGIYLYNRDGLYKNTDPYDFYPKLDVENDPGHAFYLGVELARAQIAWQLGKRFSQDEELEWGCAVGKKKEDLKKFQKKGPTLDDRKKVWKKLHQAKKNKSK